MKKLKLLWSSTLLLSLLTLTACSSEEDMLPDPVERISLLLDYETGYGGYIYPVYNTYVFFKDGTVVKESRIPVDELNLNAISSIQASRWGTWQKNGDKVMITYSNGNVTEKEYPGSPAVAARRGETLDGHFSSISGGGNLAFGGSVGTLNYSRMSFTSDGWYTTENISGSHSSSHSAYHTNTTSGRYIFDSDYSITLTANNGQVQRFFFCWYSGQERNFRLAGRTFNIRR